jgi:hypothetical protein
MFHPLKIRDAVHVTECKDCQEHLALSGKTAQQLYDEFCKSKPTYQWDAIKNLPMPDALEPKQ